MLVSSPTRISWLSSMYEWMHICMKKKKGKENITLRWWSDWANCCCPIKIMWWFTEPTFINLFLFTYLQSLIWIGSYKILSWKLSPSYDQFWKIITESLWSIPMSNSRMWYVELDDLGSRVIGSGPLLTQKNQV